MQRRKLGSSAWKRTFSASDVASSIATGQVTSDSLKYPRQKGRGATANLLQDLQRGVGLPRSGARRREGLKRRGPGRNRPVLLRVRGHYPSQGIGHDQGNAGDCRRHPPGPAQRPQRDRRVARRIGDNENGALFKEMSTKLLAHAKAEQEVPYSRMENWPNEEIPAFSRSKARASTG